MRQFERFFNALTRFKINSFSADVSVFNIKLKDLTNKNGINIISCSKTPLKRYLNYSNGSSFLDNPTKNTNNVLVQTLSASNLAESLEVFPNLILLEKHTYSYDDTASSVLSLEPTNTYLHHTSLSIASSLYSTLVLLTLLNTLGSGCYAKKNPYWYDPVLSGDQFEISESVRRRSGSEPRPPSTRASAILAKHEDEKKKASTAVVSGAKAKAVAPEKTRPREFQDVDGVLNRVSPME
jgi:hypothetical protein